MTSHHRLIETAQYALEQVRHSGIEACEATLSSQTGYRIQVRLGDLDALEHHHEQELSLTVYHRQRTATVTTHDLTHPAVSSVVDKACSRVAYMQEDPCSGLVDADQLADHAPTLHLSYPWDLSPTQAIDCARACEAYAMDQDTRLVNSEGVDLCTQQSMVVQTNSHGFVGYYPKTYHSMSCSLIAQQQNGTMERDYDSTIALDFNNLMHYKQLALSAATRTLNRLGARPLKTRVCPVVFAAPVASVLWSGLARAISGGALYRRASFLLDSLGQQLFPSEISIHERPHDPQGLGSAPFDAEGVCLGDRPLVDQGVLCSYMLNSYTARQLKLHPTGHAGGIRNWHIAHRSAVPTLEALLHKMGTGLLVTEWMGDGVSCVTGDFSKGAFGYWIEHGQVAYPVTGITVAGRLQDMFQGIVGVASDTDRRHSIQTGSVLIDRMTVAGSAG